MNRPSLKAQVLQLREDAIVDAVNRLLATKGYDLMTVDAVAAEAGMAKASLYKHFQSKEDLAGAAMVRILDHCLAVVNDLRARPEGSPLDNIKDVARWAMRTQLAGEMPSLPSQNSALSHSLQAKTAYMDRLFDLSNKLGIWITEAQTSGQIDPTIPAEMVLYTLFACACNPVLGMMKASQTHTDEQIVAWMVQATFEGLGPKLIRA
jgi:TetR/AcrR family transcriptional regulator, regulator of autoinduction and epiphytic fitness